MTSTDVDGEIRILPKSRVDVLLWQPQTPNIGSARIEDLATYGLFFRLQMRCRENLLH